MAQLYNVTALRKQCVAVMMENYDKIRDDHFPAALKAQTTDDSTTTSSTTSTDAPEAAPTADASDAKETRLELDEATARDLINRQKKLQQPVWPGFFYVPLKK